MRNTEVFCSFLFLMQSYGLFDETLFSYVSFISVFLPNQHFFRDVSFMKTNVSNTIHNPKTTEFADILS